MAAMFNYLDELRPIFAAAPIREGGLGLTTDVLAWCLAFGGVVFIVFSLTGMAPELTRLQDAAAAFGSD